MVARMKKAPPTKAQSITHCTGNTSGLYHPGELLDPPVRVNAAQSFGLPSRVGQRLRHPDGRVTDLAGQPLPAGTVL